MKREDLVFGVVSSTAGWLTRPKRGEQPSIAHAIHSELLQLVERANHRNHVRGEFADRDRRLLLREINRMSGELLVMALCALEELRDTHCRFAFEQTDEDNNVSIGRFDFDEVSLVTHPLAVLQIAESLRFLRPSEQVALAKALLVESELNSCEQQREFAVQFESAHAVSRWAIEVASVGSRLKSVEGKLTDIAKEWLAETRKAHKSFVWLTASMPVEVPISCAGAELESVGRWFDSLANSMFQPFTLDAMAPRRQLVRWQELWTIYAGCGKGFSVLAVWLRTMGAGDEFRRCEVCYRHLGVGMKRFCREHIRTAKKHQSSRLLHVSFFYKQAFRATQKRTPDLREIFSDAALDGKGRSTLASMAADLVAPDLVQPAVVLAKFLRALWPVLTPAIRGQRSSSLSTNVGTRERAIS